MLASAAWFMSALLAGATATIYAFVHLARNEASDHRYEVEPAGDVGLTLAPPPPERRVAERRSLVRRVSLRRDGGAAEPQSSFAFNLSPDGVLLAGPASLEVGESVWLEIPLDPGAGPAGTWAHVVHETPTGHKGIQFDALRAEDRSALEAFLAADLALAVA